MTERIYYKDPTILAFEAKIVETDTKDDLFITVMDRTAFYPTSGGQLYDTGSLNDAKVVEVLEDNDRIIHYTKEGVGKVGDQVAGIIDKKRRQINRQNHTAQHILSQVFYRLYNLETVSVHLGEEYGAIELNTNKMSPEQFLESEKLANEVVNSSLDIETLFIDSSDIDKYPLRKIPKRSGNIRIIKIGEFEYSACGGTHCNSSAEVGLIKLTETEKLRNHVLIKFLAGSLAFEDYSKRYDITSRMTKIMTCNLNDIINKFENLSEDNKGKKKQITQLNKELMPVMIDKIVQNTEIIKDENFVFKIIDEIDKKLLNKIAINISENISGIAVISSDSKLIIAIDKSIKLSAGEIAKAVSSKFNIKGGGNVLLAQMGGTSPDQLDEIRDFIKELVSNEL